MVDFCAEAPGRRAGVAQILLNDVDAAVAEIRWVKESGLKGGILLPGVPPGSSVEPYHAVEYEPIWAACAEYDVPINNHGGTSGPEQIGTGKHPSSGALFMIETSWFSHRTLWQMIFSGVFERYPTLKLALTEQGTGWVPGTLTMLDDFYDRFTSGKDNMEVLFAGEQARTLSMKPTEYFNRNVFMGSSFLRPQECKLRYEIGVDNIMWGADYPHNEGTTPYSREALRYTFAGVDPDEVRTMLGTTAATVYDLDLGAARRAGRRDRTDGGGGGAAAPRSRDSRPLQHGLVREGRSPALLGAKKANRGIPDSPERPMSRSEEERIGVSPIRLSDP